MVLPKLTPEERTAALQKAAVARQQRAQLKDDVKTGQKKVSDIINLAASDPVAAKMRVVDLLQAMPGIGPAKAERIMERAQISPSRRVGGLGKHQKVALIDLFG